MLIASIKPSEDRQAWIVRLFNAGDQAAKPMLRWGGSPPRGVWLSNLAEEKGTAVTGAVAVPARGLVTLRADLPE